MLSDIQIAQRVQLLPIKEIAKKINLEEDDIEAYGNNKAKIKLDVIDKFKDRPDGKYILVSAITPTPLGEGKTVTTIGLSMALGAIGKKIITCIRQPSLGPVFGIKGGAAGGGFSQVVPMEDFNLHFTGDVHAVGLAHNLCAAYLDNHICKGNTLGINPETIMWRRVVDVSDRYLRQVKIGLGGKNNGIPRDSGFDITVASEIMAILALTDSIKDLRKRLGRIVLAVDKNGKFVTCEDIKVAGSMAALLKDAIKPNLIQTLENTPCIVHAGPFANIAHGNSSILADRIALKLADYVVTEAGFGADCGAEKFFNIKCRASGLVPNAVVLVCTIRALKMHSGKFVVKPGRPLAKELISEDIESIKEGACNLEKQIENIKIFGLPCVVAINRFQTDTDKEIELVRRIAIDAGAEDAIESNVFLEGSKGGIKLAEEVVKAAKKQNHFKFLYPLDLPIEEKMRVIAQRIYGAKDIEISEVAKEKINLYNSHGFDKIPICMAKTHLSLSHDPAIKGRPQDFSVPIKDIRLSAGANFLYPLLGNMQTMPGLPTHPAGEKIDIDDNGKIVGLF